MADWSKMRKVWTDARDKHGVKKGAVSGVSVGDAIEKVEKSLSKGYTSVIAAATALQVALGKYKDKIQKANPAFAGWIDKNIAKDAKELADAARLDLASLKWVIDNLFEDVSVNTYTLLPDSATATKVNKLVLGTPPQTWEQAAKSLGLFAGTERLAPLVAKRGTTLKAMKWNLRLSGHEKNYAQLLKYAETTIADVKFCLKWSQVKDIAQFLAFMQEVRGMNTVRDVEPDTKAAVKEMMG